MGKTTKSNGLSTGERFWRYFLNVPHKHFFVVLMIFGAFMAAFPQITPIRVDSTVRNFYNFVQNIPPGSVFLLEESADMRNPTQAQMDALIVWQQLFLKPDLKILVYSLNSVGPINVETILKVMPDWIKAKKTYGVDYVYLGFIPGDETGLAALFSNIRGICTTDYFGNPIDSLSMMVTGHPKTGGPINDGTAFYASLPTTWSATFIEAHVRVAGETWHVPLIKPNLSALSWSFYAPFVPKYIPQYYIATHQVEYEYLVGIPGPNMAYYSARFYFTIGLLGMIAMINIRLAYERIQKRKLEVIK